MTRKRFLPLLAAAGLTLAGCGTEAESHAGAAAGAATPVPVPAEVTTAAYLLSVSTGDFYFRAPSTIPAGLTTIRLSNAGPEMHHVQLVRINEGRTLADLLAEVAKGRHVPEWVELLGGPNVPAPGAASEATMVLTPGSYALVCVIPSKDGVPHLMKGMSVPLTVVPGPSSAIAEPAADVRLVLDDYSYGFAPELSAGRHTLRVENVAAQPHEVFIARLAPGKTVKDVLDWMREEQGPPPFTPTASTTMLSRGEVNYVTADFAAGEYALLCFAPDAKDGQPHVAHGMVRQLTVR